MFNILHYLYYINTESFEWKQQESLLGTEPDILNRSQKIRTRSGPEVPEHYWIKALRLRLTNIVQCPQVQPWVLLCIDKMKIYKGKKFELEKPPNY